MHRRVHPVRRGARTAAFGPATPDARPGNIPSCSDRPVGRVDRLRPPAEAGGCVVDDREQSDGCRDESQDDE